MDAGLKPSCMVKSCAPREKNIINKKKVTVGLLSFYSDDNKPIGKKDGVVLVVWVFRVVFVDWTMLSRNV